LRIVKWNDLEYTAATLETDADLEGHPEYPTVLARYLRANTRPHLRKPRPGFVPEQSEGPFQAFADVPEHLAHCADIVHLVPLNALLRNWHDTRHLFHNVGAEIGGVPAAAAAGVSSPTWTDDIVTYASTITLRYDHQPVLVVLSSLAAAKQLCHAFREALPQLNVLPYIGSAVSRKLIRKAELFFSQTMDR